MDKTKIGIGMRVESSWIDIDGEVIDIRTMADQVEVRVKWDDGVISEWLQIWDVQEIGFRNKQQP